MHMKDKTVALFDILGLNANCTLHQAEAELITSKLGGLSLALNQVGGFFVQRKIPFNDYLALTISRCATKIQ